MELSRDTELRKVPVSIYQNLLKFFEGDDDSLLGLLMGNIRADLNNPDSKLRFTTEDVDAIRNYAQNVGESPVVTLMNEWSTMGRSRPNLGHLLDLLIKCELFRAAEFLAEKIHQAQPERPLQGPAARVDILLRVEVESLVNGLDYPFSTIEANKDKTNKPSLNSPNMKFDTEQSRVDNTSMPFIKPPASTNLMKFPRTIPLQQSAASSSAASIPDINALKISNHIPATVNSDIVQDSGIIPAISGLMQNGDSQNLNHIPRTLHSMEIYNLETLQNAGAPGPSFSKIFNGESSSQITESTRPSSSLSSSSDT